MSTLSNRSLSSYDPSRRATPRRRFPQELISQNHDDLGSKEQAPVVFDASLNFVLGVEKQRVRQSFRPTASHLEPSTASSHLSSRIAEFLRRTDHVMNEWKSLGHRDEVQECEDLISLPHSDKRLSLRKSRSATNIMIKGYQYFSRANSVSRASLSRLSEDRTIDENTDGEVGRDCC